MIHNNISMFFSFSVSCFMSLLLNTMKAAAEAGWRLSLCSLWCLTWHSCWNNGARIKISSFSLTHCSRQLRSFAELSSEPLLWLQIFFFLQWLLWYGKNTRVVSLPASSALSCCVTIPCLDSFPLTCTLNSPVNLHSQALLSECQLKALCKIIPIQQFLTQSL